MSYVNTLCTLNPNLHPHMFTMQLQSYHMYIADSTHTQQYTWDIYTVATYRTVSSYLNNTIFTFTDETYFLRPDHCCFSSETNSTTTSCNVSVSGLNTSTVGGQRLPLQLEPTDHNLVCNENVLSLTVEVSDGESFMYTYTPLCE